MPPVLHDVLCTHTVQLTAKVSGIVYYKYKKAMGGCVQLLLLAVQYTYIIRRS